MQGRRVAQPVRGQVGAGMAPQGMATTSGNPRDPKNLYTSPPRPVGPKQPAAGNPSDPKNLYTTPPRPGPKQPAPRQPDQPAPPPSQAGSLAGWTRAMYQRQQSKQSTPTPAPQASIGAQLKAAANRENPGKAIKAAIGSKKPPPSMFDREWDRLDRADQQAPAPMPSTDEAEIRRLARMRRSRLGQ